MTFRPENYNAVSPYLLVNGAVATIEFLESVFAAERCRMFFRDDGTLQHGEVRIDDTVLMLADAMEGWPAVPAHVHIYVADVDATYRSALEVGATSVQEPIRKGDPDKRGGVRDAGGTTWWISQQIGEGSSDQ
ncbi:VOC family protein [Rhodanobacter sp. L36]|uniref:VOC family protein n=1 Tax=Rhodanobacter sp. L36 TaxID=1747221 RepID=UPI00131C8361|nr:VOC family protein [Rhodanobacter sp. L36]